MDSNIKRIPITINKMFNMFDNSKPEDVFILLTVVDGPKEFPLGELEVEVLVLDVLVLFCVVSFVFSTSSVLVFVLVFVLAFWLASSVRFKSIA